MIVLDLSLAPGAIERLVKWLLENGYSVTDERASGRNNQYALFTAGDRTVKVTVTRGDWDLEIGVLSRTSHPQAWEAWLDGHPLPRDLATVDQQVDFIIKRWDGAIERFRKHPGAEEQMEVIGDDWVGLRFGFRPRRRTG